jgi:hypothetical protein
MLDDVAGVSADYAGSEMQAHPIRRNGSHVWRNLTSRSVVKLLELCVDEAKIGIHHRSCFWQRWRAKLERSPRPRARCIARNGYAMNKKLKFIPKFRSEAEERRFWETHDSSSYVDWNKGERVRLPNLKSI